MADTAAAQCPECGSDDTDYVEEYSDGTTVHVCLECETQFEVEPEE